MQWNTREQWRMNKRANDHTSSRASSPLEPHKGVRPDKQRTIASHTYWSIGASEVDRSGALGRKSSGFSGTIWRLIGR